MKKLLKSKKLRYVLLLLIGIFLIWNIVWGINYYSYYKYSDGYKKSPINYDCRLCIVLFDLCMDTPILAGLKGRQDVMSPTDKKRKSCRKGEKRRQKSICLRSFLVICPAL